jgi:hypothetical protein
VFVAPSGKPSATNAVDEYPFGYIKTSSSMQSVGLIVTAYNFPALLPLLDEIAKDKSVLATTGFRQRFEKYMKTVPFYYYAVRVFCLKIKSHFFHFRS